MTDRKALIMLGAAATALLLPSLAAAQLEPQLIAERPPGTFLENLAVLADGTAVITSYMDKRLLVLSPRGALTPLVELPDHPVGILAVPDGFIVSAHGRSFTDGEAFTRTNRVLLLDRRGRVRRAADAPEARFLNGLARLPGGTVLAADSIAGTIWRVDPATGALKPWLVNPRLQPDPAVAPFRPGANGLKVRGGLLYVSNSSRGEIARIPLGPDDRPTGPIADWAHPGPVDDFDFGPDGTLYAATHGAALLAIDTDGVPRPVFSEGCDGCTSVAVDRGRLLVLTTGGLVEGLGRPARVLSVRLTRPGGF
jgi:hypothetical protein